MSFDFLGKGPGSQKMKKAKNPPFLRPSCVDLAPWQFLGEE